MNLSVFVGPFVLEVDGLEGEGPLVTIRSRCLLCNEEVYSRTFDAESVDDVVRADSHGVDNANANLEHFRLRHSGRQN